MLPINEKLSHFIAFGPGTWGKGITEAEAVANMKKAGGNRHDYDLYRAHPGTEVDGMGDFSYPRGEKPGENAPVKVRSVRNGKERPIA